MTNHLVSTGDLPRLVLLTGHSAPIDSIAFSPDGRTLATGSLNGTVILWDLPTNSMRARLRGHGWNTRLAFSPDGTTLATVDTNAIRLWQTATGKWQGTLPGYTEPLAFASPSQLLAGVSGDELVRLDSESGKVLDRLLLATGDPLRCASAISPDASTLVIAVYQGSTELRVWDLETSSLKRRRRVPETLWWKERDPETGKLDTTHGAQADVHHLAISPNNRLLAVGGRFTLWLCDLRTGKRTHLLICGEDGVASLSFSASGQLLAAGTNSGKVKVWALPSGREVQSLPAHSSWATAIDFSRDGQRVASASHDKTIKVWDVATGRCEQRLPGRVTVGCTSFAPDGQTFASGHEDGTVRCWDASTGRLLRTLHCQNLRVTAIAFSVNENTMACSSIDPCDREKPGAVEYWNLDVGERLQLWEYGVRGIDSVSLLSQGPMVVASGRSNAGEETWVWNRESGDPCYRVEGHAATVSPDELLLATTMGWKGRISLWDTATGARCRDLAAPQVADGVVSLRFSPDGNTLLAGFYGYGIGLWSVATGEQLWEVGTHADSISSVAFSPDGRTIAVGGDYRREVVLWHLQPKVEAVRTLTGHDCNVRAVSFYPDGRKVVTASADGTLKVWDAAEGRLLATFLVLPTTDGSVSEAWITFTPSGHYLGSAGSDKYVNWQVGERLLPAEAFRAEFHRPERVAEALR